MKRWLYPLLAAASLLLSGCASVIESNVTAFHAWSPGDNQKDYAFAPAKDQENDLQYQNYAGLIRQELQFLGFTEARDLKSAQLQVSFSYGMNTGQVVVSQPAYDPFFYGPGPGWGRFGPRPFGFYGPYGPFYDPFWYGAPMQTTSYPVFLRRLQIGISQASDGKKLFDVVVDSEGQRAGLAEAMPAMVRAAFDDFPGPSGVTRHIRIKVDKNGQPED
ncbi:lipoprotein [Herbaspirillum sp. GW103]|jgi:hypothetical protein|uniref:DUF4136 domain-containing protein n=1 Tax=unclassified Herbaspirillum TaxID=2624150 RepID=UPI00025E2706|nr:MULTISPECIES: DUF4136 domain-containing protein [unclassified Herbaspirillum]EIJ45874.1 lipoprotein [Herbaspirillum sp. GW103]MCI1003311.1 DUF4136 domain-containing protein [Herbaspirillum sp. C7C8]